MSARFDPAVGAAAAVVEHLPAGLPTTVSFRLLKAPRCTPVSGRDPAVAAKVSEMLLRIERDGNAIHGLLKCNGKLHIARRDEGF